MKKSEVSKIFLSEALNAFQLDGFVKEKDRLIKKQGEEFLYYIRYAITDYIYEFPTSFNFGISPSVPSLLALVHGSRLHLGPKITAVCYC